MCLTAALCFGTGVAPAAATAATAGKKVWDVKVGKLRQQKDTNIIGYGDGEVAYFKFTDYAAAQEAAKAGDSEAIKDYVEVEPVNNEVYQAVYEIQCAREAAKRVLKKDQQGFEDLALKAGFAEKETLRMGAIWTSARNKLKHISADRRAAARQDGGNLVLIGDANVKNNIEEVANDILFQAARKLVILFKPGMEAEWKQGKLGRE